MIKQEIVSINNGLSEKDFKVFYIGLNDYVMKSFLADLQVKHHWLGLNHFFYKEYGWKPNYKPNSKKAKQARLLGNIFKSIYEMCKETYLNQKLINYDVPWDDGFQWFGRCCRDFTTHLLLNDYQRSKNADKRTIISEWKNELSTLKSLEFPPKKAMCLSDYNPYLKYGDELMGLITLIEISYSLAAIKPNFDKKYWKPYLDSIDVYVEDLELNMIPHKYTMTSKSKYSDDVSHIEVINRPKKGGNIKKSIIKVEW